MNAHQRQSLFFSAVDRAAKRIDRSWARSCYALVELAPIAVDVLHDAQLHKRFSEPDLITWMAASKLLPKQCDPFNKLGNPSLTLWCNNHLSVDVSFWGFSVTTLHDHGFAGAVSALSGAILQAEYVFTKTEQYSKRVELGETVSSRGDPANSSQKRFPAYGLASRGSDNHVTHQKSAKSWCALLLSSWNQSGSFRLAAST
jgi:hypothetical protein